MGQEASDEGVPRSVGVNDLVRREGQHLVAELLPFVAHNGVPLSSRYDHCPLYLIGWEFDFKELAHFYKELRRIFALSLSGNLIHKGQVYPLVFVPKDEVTHWQ